MAQGHCSGAGLIPNRNKQTENKQRKKIVQSPNLCFSPLINKVRLGSADEEPISWNDFQSNQSLRCFQLDLYIMKREETQRRVIETERCRDRQREIESEGENETLIRQVKIVSIFF